MDLGLKNKTFLVGGATSGLGNAIVLRLIAEGAKVIGAARSRDKLSAMQQELGDAFVPYAADLTDGTAVRILGESLAKHNLSGCVFNAGGPPTGSIEELEMQDWDAAYASTLRWKIQLTKAVIPLLKKKKDGRLLYLESVSIKQPIDHLVLSNAMRAAVAGFVKTLSHEIGEHGITANVLAPGYHATARITTVLQKSADLQGLSLEDTEATFTAETAVKKLGDPQDFAAMAAFLLSPSACYITGQTISVDGGVVRHITG